MSTFVEAKLVNGVFDDSAVAVRFRFGRRVMLFDIGDVRRLSPRTLQTVDLVCVSHRHMDHFSGFDHFLGVRLYRAGMIRLFGPEGFVDGIEHKLAAYTFDLLGPDSPDLRIIAGAFGPDGEIERAEFRAREAFVRRPLEPRMPAGVIHEEDEFRVEYEILDHATPVLAFALQERQSVHVVPERLEALGLPVGPWLTRAKAALRRGAGDDTRLDADGRRITLGELADGVFRVGRGQRVAYVTDCAYTVENVRRIRRLAAEADHLLIEAGFLHQDAANAASRHHLTARQAGWIAREAGVRRATPFHFSGRYEGREKELRAEFRAARAGRSERPEPAAV